MLIAISEDKLNINILFIIFIFHIFIHLAEHSVICRLHPDLFDNSHTNNQQHNDDNNNNIKYSIYLRKLNQLRTSIVRVLFLKKKQFSISI